MNITEQIAEHVTIPDILHKYGFQTGIHNRIICPIHNGHKANFCYTDHVFHCWTCQAHGNCISLVAQIFGISNKQAVIKINNDFNLHLTEERPTYRDKLRIREMEAQRQAREVKAEQGHEIYLQINQARRELFSLYGDDIEQVLYLDRLLDAYGKDPAPLVDWQVDIENLIINLKEVCKTPC